jgi:pimeloyl-ACP methyl ester carboxylesterase
MTPESTIDVQGVTVRYRDSGGTGMPILLTHGIGGSLELWGSQFGTSLAHHRLIAWDMPGHGLSGMGDQPYDSEKLARFAWQFLEALGIQRLVLAGNSLGGSVSLFMTGLAPDRVAGLVLANSASLGREVFTPFRIMTLPLLGELMCKPSQTGVERQIEAIFHHPLVATPALREVITRNVYKPGGDKAMLATLRRMSDLGGTQSRRVLNHVCGVLRSVRVPVLFVHGRHDKVLALEHSVAAHAITPGSKLLVLEDCGHTPQLEKPAEFNDALNNLVSACA